MPGYNVSDHFNFRPKAGDKLIAIQIAPIILITRIAAHEEKRGDGFEVLSTQQVIARGNGQQYLISRCVLED